MAGFRQLHRCLDAFGCQPVAIAREMHIPVHSRYRVTERLLKVWSFPAFHMVVETLCLLHSRNAASHPLRAASQLIIRCDHRPPHGILERNRAIDGSHISTLNSILRRHISIVQMRSDNAVPLAIQSITKFGVRIFAPRCRINYVLLLSADYSDKSLCAADRESHSGLTKTKS